VRIAFDSTIISYADLLYIFWRAHDPTTLNRQGADVGTQYRSAIFYHTDEQKRIAEQSKQETNASDLWPDPIVTEISPFTNFYEAEAYHHDYFRRNPNQPYCRAVIEPKAQKFRHTFQEKLKNS
jgi:peptide-methionine (S)-S-oxide reductase